MQDRILNIVNSNDLQVLSHVCASIISENPLDDPFESETILVMNSGMKTYLSQELANFCQVQANCRYVHVWQIIWEIYKSINNIEETRNPFASDYMLINILALKDLWSDKNSDESFFFKKLASYIEHDDTGDKAYELCKKIADIFDQYQMYRKDYILAWDEFTQDDFQNYKEGKANAISTWIDNVAASRAPFNANLQEKIKDSLKDNIWQIRLWDKMRHNLDVKAIDTTSLDYDSAVFSIHKDRAQMLESLKLSLSDASIKDKVPPRIFVFGVSALPVSVIDILEALSQVSSVYIMLLNPCAQYWGDIQDQFYDKFDEFAALVKLKFKDDGFKLPSRYKKYKKKDFTLKKDDYTFDESSDSGLLQEGNALLLSLGKQGRDNLSLLLEKNNNTNFIDAFCELEGDSLLTEIKKRLLELSDNAFLTKYEIKKDDRSLEIHSCHTKLREVEVLKDRLLNLFNSYKDKKLRPRDIVVMVPQINTYAPYIQSVFAANRLDSEYLPYAISDRSAGEENAVADALISLLSLDKIRISNNFILDLLTIPAIASKFGFLKEHIELISSWFENTNIIWGLDDESFSFDCETKDIKKLDENLPFTFEKGLNRMLDGALLGQSDDTSVFTDIEGSDIQILASLYLFIQKIAHLKKVFYPSLCLDIKDSEDCWQDRINTLIQDFFDIKDEACQEVIAIIAKSLDSIANIILDLKQKVDINLTTFRQMLKQEFEKVNEFSPFLRDKINFCSLMPMRAVPFEHVFILGLNDSEFPRQDVLLNFNLMSLPALIRKGDRSSTSEDRFLFLEAIISAKKSLYLSYIGQDAKDNSTLNPSTVLSELIDYIVDNCTLEGFDKDSITDSDIVHRLLKNEHLHGFDIDNYKKQETGDPLYFPSFNKEYFEQCRVQGETHSMSYLAISDFNLQLLDNYAFDVDDFIQGISDFPSFFLNKVMDIYVGDVKAQTLDERESFKLQSLDKGLIILDLIDKMEQLDKDVMLNLFTNNKSLDAFLEKELLSKQDSGVIPYSVFAKSEILNIKERFIKVIKKIFDFGLSLNIMPDNKFLYETFVDANDNKYLDKKVGVTISGSYSLSKFKIFALNKIKAKSIAFKVVIKSAIHNCLCALQGLNDDIYILDGYGNYFILKPYTNDEAKEVLNTLIAYFIALNKKPLPMCNAIFDTLILSKNKESSDPSYISPAFDEFIDALDDGESKNISFNYLFNDLTKVKDEDSSYFDILHDFYDFYTQKLIAQIKVIEGE